MKSSDSALEAALRDHLGWMRRLARQLVLDPHSADDIVQETWLAAMRSGPRHPGSLPGWLGRVVRNVASNVKRSEARRARRQRLVALEEALPSTLESVERIELQQRVLAAVLELREPLRGTIIQRFQENRTPREIAHREGVPLETVRTRLRRGLTELRRSLDERSGGRRSAWCVGLFALSKLPQPWTLPLGGIVMTQKKIALTAGGLALAALATLPYWSRPSVELDEPASRSVAELDSLPRAGQAVSRASLPETDRSAEPPLTTSEPHRTPQVELVHVAGDVLLQRADGSIDTRVSGRLQILRLPELVDGSCLIPASSELVWVRIEDGRFSAEIPRSPRYVAGKIELPAVPAPCLDPDSVRMSEGNGNRILVLTPTRPVLVVRDRDRQFDLEGLEIVTCDDCGIERGDLLPRETYRTLTTEGRSPFALPERTGPHPYWVRAPGHAWGRIEIDHGSVGERVLDLPPASSLTVTVLGGPLPEDSRVQLTRESWTSGVLLERRVTDSTTQLESLPGGHYGVELIAGDRIEGIPLGRTQVSLEEGVSQGILIQLDRTELESPKVPLRGVVTVPESVDTFHLQLTRQTGAEGRSGQEAIRIASSAMTEVEGAPNRLRWDAGRVRPGQYVAFFRGFQHREPFEVHPDRENVIELTIPELADVTVTFVDTDSGADVHPIGLQWADGELEGVATNWRQNVYRDFRTGGYRFTATAGTVELYLEDPRYQVVEPMVTLQPGENRLTVSVLAASTVVISFEENGSRVDVPFEYWWDMKVRDPEGPADLIDQKTTRHRSTRYYARAGRYTFELPDLEGFEPIGTREVVLEKGRPRDLVIEVTRADR
ncbi:MAG: RNA polymerase sigma factor [Planctomycetota bacterium]